MQVKSGEDNVGREVVQALIGNLGQGEYGLLITIGKFTVTAREFAKSRNTARLIDGPELVQLVLKHYKCFEPRYNALIPLKRLYVPQPSGDSALT